jgi:hypothetical protein
MRWRELALIAALALIDLALIAWFWLHRDDPTHGPADRGATPPTAKEPP